MALLLVGGRRVLADAHVARVEAGDQPLDRPSLAGRVPSLEDDAQRRAEPAVAEEAAAHEAQVQEPQLGALEAGRRLRRAASRPSRSTASSFPIPASPAPRRCSGLSGRHGRRR